MKQNQNSRPWSEGFSLVELLVAMVVGLVLLGGIYQVFIGSSSSYSINESLSRVQENGRFAIYLMRDEVLGAGYLGCLQDTSTLSTALNDPTAFVLNFSQGVYGLEATGVNVWQDDVGAVNPAAAGSTALALTAPVSESDVLVIRGVDPNMTVELTTEMPLSTSALTLPPGLSGVLAANDVLLITDCEGAAVFQVTGYNNGDGTTDHVVGVLPLQTDPAYPRNSTTDLGHTFAEGSEVFSPRTVAYYVRQNPIGEPSLYRKIGLSAVEELVQGVESMQISYGVDTNGDRAADSYVKANGIISWSEVVSVRLWLLMRSAEEILRGPVDTALYDIDGDGTIEIGPANDQRLRMVMSTTIGLRNRLR